MAKNKANFESAAADSTLSGLSIVSWNVNGLRAVHRKGALEPVFRMKPDILCIQETKSRPDQLTEDILNPVGYQSHFHYPDFKKGYSGVAIYTKPNPLSVSHETEKAWKDEEGRILVAEYPDFTLINCYFPNGGGVPERLAYKLDFYEKFLKFVKKLHMKQPNMVICGDFNVAHSPIDLARPKENETHVGFLPEERAWMDKFISNGWIDVFRHLNPDKITYTYWDQKTFARERNVGWRIDYFFVSEEMLKRVKSMEILENILGSDHCPIKITFI